MGAKTKKFAIHQTVGEIAARFQEAIPLFEDLKIDYCCGGARTLEEACLLAGVPVEKVVTDLEGLESQPKEPSGLPDWENEKMSKLIEYILNDHHLFTRTQLGRLKILSHKVNGVHGDRHPELSRLKEIIEEMAEEMEGHMAKEEEQVFPYLKALEETQGNKEGVANPFGGEESERHPLKVLMWEHAMTGEEWIEIHKLTNDMTTPKDGCQSYDSLYGGLRELEQNLHRHVHLENNVLFQKAIRKGWLD